MKKNLALLVFPFLFCCPGCEGNRSGDGSGKEGSHPAPEEAATALVEGVVASLGRGAYSEFRELTCLGMEKEAFKNFRNGIRDSKVTRVWDGVRDDFVAGMED